ncbi:hypothetical protein BU17DRAFT_77472 [Hysterangium stoloniferum]|nr:hypothetical protein BU17DRAFT_77472 [Hysterangium stoloniferum]
MSQLSGRGCYCDLCASNNAPANHRQVQRSCLPTIFACSWVSVHPNMPEPGEAWWPVMLRRLELMVWAIIAPELIIYWAVRQWNGARRLERRYRHLKWTVTHGHFIQMGGFMLFEGQDAKGTLSPERFEELLKERKIQFPTITKEEIQDRLVIVQTTWFIIQCISRKIQGLDTTQMELLTLALATLNGVMYFLWWDKPLGVRCPVSVHFKLANSRLAKTSWSIWFRNGWIQFCAAVRPIIARLRYAASRPLSSKPLLMVQVTSYSTGQKSDRSKSVEYGQMRVPSLYALVSEEENRLTKIDFPSPIVATVFGAIHCIGWFYTFPTHTEAVLWRICSVLVTIIPILFTILYLGFGSLTSEEDVFDWIMWVVEGLLMSIPVYILARLGLLVEAVISLRALPPKAYANVEWTSFLPHI